MEIKEGFIRPQWITPSEIQSKILQIVRNSGLILRRPRSMAALSLLSIDLGRLRIKNFAYVAGTLTTQAYKSRV